MNYRKWCIRTWDMNIYISAYIAVIKHQYVFCDSSCNLNDNAILISWLVRRWQGGNDRIFKQRNCSYRSWDTMPSFPEWCSWQYIFLLYWMKDNYFILEMLPSPNNIETWYTFRWCLVATNCEEIIEKDLFLNPGWGLQIPMFFLGNEDKVCPQGSDVI